jgi:phage tail sheath protein FI
MPQYLAPNLYIEEQDNTGTPIDGVDVSTAGFVGITEVGEMNVAVPIESFAEFTRRFGAAPNGPMSRAADEFFGNGGRRAYIVRVPPVQGRAVVESIIGNAADASGLTALACGNPPGLVLTPDAAFLPEKESAAVAAAALRLCEQIRAFHLFDVPEEASRSITAVSAWAERSTVLHSGHGAVYYPWLRVDPGLLMPPSAVVAGLFARTDAEAGVWTAAAGTGRALRSASGVAAPLSDAEVAALQAAGVNALRQRDDVGVFVWGARTFAAPDASSHWKYVPVRRTALFLERSLDEGLRWAVFEPSGAALWDRVRLAASSFLHTMFRAGALKGMTPREAYFVRCGRDTMTEEDIANGRLVLVIGVALLKPAEFVVLRIGLWSSSDDR